MSHYTENKNKIEVIRSKDEAMFRMAISHLMDVGIRHLTEENIKSTCEEIMKQDDSHSFMTNQYQCDLVIMAGELAKIPHIDLIVYISREVNYDVFDGGISYTRAIQMAQKCIDWITCDVELTDARADLNAIGFGDEELETLGYSYLLNNDEEEA
jgi:hypothetical protein